MTNWRPRRGKAHHAAKLNPAMVREIRERHTTGELQKDLAEEFGVNFRTISEICRRVTWRHIP